MNATIMTYGYSETLYIAGVREGYTSVDFEDEPKPGLVFWTTDEVYKQRDSSELEFKHQLTKELATTPQEAVEAVFGQVTKTIGCDLARSYFDRLFLSPKKSYQWVVSLPLVTVAEDEDYWNVTFTFDAALRVR